MGLTISYSLKARGSDAHARKIIGALHQTAQDLPFKELGQIVNLSGDECKADRRDKDDPLGWLLVQAGEDIELVAGRRVINGQTCRTWKRVQPNRIIVFTALPGEGCEQSNFGFCKFPAAVETQDGAMKTKLSGWRWSSFCKTQYASDPSCGGVPNFLQCHLCVIAMLDKAKELHCLEHVTDEGGFWAKRDLQALVQHVGSDNERIAAFGGWLKDLLGNGPLGVESAISHYPNFERLEAAGQSKLPPEFEKLAKLIGRVAREASAK